MGDYKLSKHIDPNKIFIVNRSEIEGRWDAEFYNPEINAWEKKVRALSSKKLRNFINYISSGATPSVKEEERFYSDKETGIPFLRVQNLQTNGKIALNDVKYINTDTHENYLKRSQVGEHDLLVKITGVGRMAIASVAPDGFIGNTNQHMVVIRTDNKNTSEYLAKYLNLDIVEKLASRRSTGGTRPALDYPALKSIPIIEGLDFSPIQKAEKIKQQKEARAAVLLAGIDDYLLGELGITLPKQDNSLQNRIFTTQFSEVVGGRLDPKLYDNYTTNLKKAILSFKNPNFRIDKLSNYIIHSVSGNWGEENIQDSFVKCLVIRATEFDNEYNLNLDNSKVKYRFIEKVKLKKLDVKENDLLIEKSGGSPDQPVGRIAIITKDILNNNTIGFSNFIHKIKINSNLLKPEYLFCYLKTIHNIKLTESMQSQTNGIRNLIMYEYLNQNIVFPIRYDGKPDVEKQNEIAKHIQDIRTQAKQLQQEAQQLLEQAKKEVEQMILGE